MKTMTAIALALAAAFAAAASVPALAAGLPSMAEPALSDDGRQIAFVCGGDIWEVPASGGIARLLVTDGATESRPFYAPGGKHLAFASTRGGNANIHVMDQIGRAHV